MNFLCLSIYFLRFHGGRCGWVAFDEAANHEIERARFAYLNANSSELEFQNQYDTDEFSLPISGRTTAVVSEIGRSAAEIEIEIQRRPYRIDLEAMTQTNCISDRVIWIFIFPKK